jgi:Tol biopolymer transport system component/DNA-binding winged helix-turn-helix (wHTH) protein
MSFSSNIFRFGSFTLDADQRVLLEEGRPVPVTPKAFQLLKALVESHGQIVEKESLIKAVWPDSFVEESNLTFNISQLRKVLGDTKDKPIFIETVARRGYRFVAEVTESDKPYGANSGEALVSRPTELNSDAFFGFSKLLLVAIAMLIVGLVVAGFWQMQKQNPESAVPILAAPYSSEKLSTDGKTFNAVISPDGKSVVYLSRSDGKESVWLRQIASGDNSEIIPPATVVYTGFAFSPGSDLLYFSRRPYNFDGQADIYRVPVSGGIPTKIVSETQGWISLSPDGLKLSFVRCYYRADEFCSLWIADSADGKNEKMLAKRTDPIRIGASAISPDGRSIAFAYGQSENAANEFHLAEIDIETGNEKTLSSGEFFNIKYLTWLPDRAGLLFTASKSPNRHFRIWKLTGDTGITQPLTNDSENYAALSLPKTADLLVTTQVKQDFNLYLSAAQTPGLRRSLTEASTVVFAPDGRIFFSSPRSGNEDIWSINPDGTEQRQLTSNAADELAPVVSPDSKAIFFSSNRTGETQVWRMSLDGSDQIQITRKEGGFPLCVSEGWLYYTSGTNRTLMRVGLHSGVEELVIKQGRYRFAISPDGTKVAYSELKDGERRLIIASIPGGEIVKTFAFPDRNSKMAEAVWLASGSELIYVMASTESERNVLWRQSLNGGQPTQIADIGSEEIWDLALSPDNKTMAVIQGRWEHDSVLMRGFK